MAKSAKNMSKMEGVRQSLQTLGKDAKPVAIQEHLKKTLNIAMTPSTISNYKSTIQKAGKKRGRPTKEVAASTNGSERHGRSTNGRRGRPKSTSSYGSISLDDIKAVKELAERIGADKLVQLAEVLA